MLYHHLYHPEKIHAKIGIDSPVAGYLALKRGVSIECLYFESPPHTSIEARNKVIKLASIINEYSGKIKVLASTSTNLSPKLIPHSCLISSGDCNSKVLFFF